MLTAKLPLFIAVVVVLAFLLLTVMFRSLLIPLLASVMNLLSVAAAFGATNAAFETCQQTSGPDIPAVRPALRVTPQSRLRR